MSKEVSKGVANPNKDELKEVERHLLATNPKIFEGIKKEKKVEILRSFTVTLEKSHSGPLPDPETLNNYNQLIPNGAERIMKMAETQQSHRHELEMKVIPAQLNQSKNGQWFGFLLGLIGLGCGTFLAYNGQETVGGIIVGTTVISLVSVFVIGKTTQKRDLEDK